MKNHPLILKLDVAGNPRAWITYERAAYYYAKDLVAWTMSNDGYRIHGGTSRLTGTQSFMDLNTIIAVRSEKGDKIGERMRSKVTLTNKTLFRRDQHICAYCGGEFDAYHLTRDHVIPSSRGGKDVWTNVVTSCGGCNRMKDARTPEEAGMKLLYVPYEPNKAEYLILMNRRVLADQMEFLKSKIPTHSRIHAPINDRFFSQAVDEEVEFGAME